MQPILFTRAVLLLSVLTSTAKKDSYVEPLSGSVFLNSCKENSTASQLLQGLCRGEIEVLFALAVTDNLGPDAKFCPPDGATNDQARLVVIKYIEDRPVLMRPMLFLSLAIHGLRKAWPCL
jgi:hypothetical protein